MKWTWLRNYAALRTELSVNERSGCECKGKYEKAFSIVAIYWTELQSSLCVDEMNVSSQVLYYKTIQPLYLSIQEYYSLVVNSFIFCPPPESVKEYRRYWIRQCQRLNRFISENKELCNYYISGQTALDEFYFTRANNEISSLSRPSPSRLIANYIALMAYHEYANGKWREAIGRIER